MEPVTHALASLTIAQAAQKRLPRYGKWMVLASGLAPDLDYASYAGGPEAFLRFHRTLLHSLLGAAVACCAIAGAFCFAERQQSKQHSDGNSPESLRFLPALAACAVGAFGHLLLDLPSGIGIQLLWPFRAKWFSWDLIPNLDPWILIALLAGLLLPQLFRLISEEIGEKKKKVRGRGEAIFAVLLFCAYLGTRSYLHSEAVDLVLSREFRGLTPLAAGAFPNSSSPFEWRGVAVTDSTVEEVDVPLGPHEEYDPDRSVPRYKPEDSPALEAAQSTLDAAIFLKYARFPLARMTRIEDGFRVEFRDMRFGSGDADLDNILVRVDLNSASHVTRQQFRFASYAGP